jgi:serine/threonine protein kinase
VGLGAVFVALDSEPHREVALKQILDQHADDPLSRQRFLPEAEVIGGLEHPGIVPVYGLGTYGNGRPHYAMRFIKGDSLKEAIDQVHADAAMEKALGRRSLELRQLLRRFTDVCKPLTMRTAVVFCIATSSRATSSWASTVRRWSSTGAWPSPWAGSSRDPKRASGRW